MTEVTDAAPAASPPATAMPDAGRPPPLSLRSPAAKFFLTGLITLMLVVPLWVVMMLTSEREARRDDVAEQIGAEWGQPQRVYGPLLVVPYLSRAGAGCGERRAGDGPAPPGRVARDDDGGGHDDEVLGERDGRKNRVEGEDDVHGDDPKQRGRHALAPLKT